MMPDGGAGMDVNAGAAVGKFSHDAGDQRHLQLKEHMGHAVDEDRLQSGVGDDDLIRRGGGGVAVEEGLQVGLEQRPNLRQPLQEADRQLLGLCIQLAGAFLIHRCTQTERDGNLLLQAIGHVLHQHGQAVLHRVDPVAGVTEVTGEKQPLQLADQADDDLAVGLGEGLDAVNVAALLIIGQQHVGQGRDRTVNGAGMIWHGESSFSWGIWVFYYTALRKSRRIQ